MKLLVSILFFACSLAIAQVDPPSIKPPCHANRTTSCTPQVDSSGNLSVGPTVVSPTSVRTGYGTSPYIPETAATVAHVLFTPTGFVDTKSNAWTYPIQPSIFQTVPPTKVVTANRTQVGVFSDSNYFTQGSAGASLAGINGAFTACVAYTITSGSNSPFILSEYSSVDAKGWGFRISGGKGSFNANGLTAITTVNGYVSLAQLQIACMGMSGTGSATGYVQLNGGPVQSGSLTYNPSTSAIFNVGRYGPATTLSFNGTVDEVWISTDAPSAAQMTAIYATAVAQQGAGYRFQDTSGTVLHLIGRTFNGTTWTAPQATMTTVGTVPSSSGAVSTLTPIVRRYGMAENSQATGTLAQTSFYYLPAGSNPLDFAGDFSGCLVLVPAASDISATSIFFGNGRSQGYGGWQVVNESGATKLWGSTGGASGAQLTANQLNVLCFGKAGANMLLKINDQPTVVSAGTVTQFNGEARLGMHYGYDIGFGGTIYEAWFSTDTPTDALFSAVVANVLLTQ